MFATLDYTLLPLVFISVSLLSLLGRKLPFRLHLKSHTNIDPSRVNQVVGSVKRGTATAYTGGMGQVGGIVSALVYPKKDGPMYVPGISTCIAFNVVGIIGAIVLSTICHWENRQRALGKRDYLRDLPPEEIEKLGEKHPDFRYTI